MIKKIDELRTRRTELENQVQELRKKIEHSEIRNAEWWAVDDARREREIKFQKNQEEHLSKFLNENKDS